MLSFWYHLGPETLATLPRNILAKYVDRLPMLLSTWQLMMIQCISVPHLAEDKDRQEVIDFLQGQLPKAKDDNVVRAETAEEFIEHISENMPFAIEIVDASGE